MSARARDAHRSASVLTLLVFIWASISLAVDPWEPFGVPNTVQAVGCAALLVYLVRTWNQPRRRVAEAISLLLIGYTLLLVPWIIVVWCRLGRPVDAFFIPQFATVSMALVFPGRLWLGITAMCLFAAESLFAFVYARYLGLDAVIPVTEPFATFTFTTLGICLFILRRQRRELARKQVRAQAEMQALERVAPLFARAQGELEKQVAILAAEGAGNGAGRVATSSSSVGRAVDRAVDRLDDLRGKLADLASHEETAASAQEAERRLLAHDAQFGATLLAGLIVFMAIPASLTAQSLLGDVPWPMLVSFLVAGAILGFLVVTRRRPSSRRALWAVFALVLTQLPALAYNQVWLLAMNRPYAPFLGHKLIMAVVGLTLASRFKLGVVLIVVTALNAIVLWFALDLGAHSDLIASGEPISTLLYMLIGIASLRLLEQRQVASIQLLRSEAEALAMHRRALMFLALRDRLNSPLQTLVLGAAGITLHRPASSTERARGAIDRLVDLSRDLAELDLLVPRLSTSFDPDNELLRHVEA